MAVIGNAYVAVHAITTTFQNDVKDALNGVNRQFSTSGTSSGSAFSSGLRRGSNAFEDFKKRAIAANTAFARVVRAGYALGPAISVAIGALSSLVSGFVALAAQVGAALPSLIVLPGIFAAIGQAALVAKLAFGGIGKAVGQLAKTGGGGGGGDEEARKKRVADAEKNLARVLESNRETLARASDNLADAEKRLTEARKAAAESLQQLNFDAEDAAISEKKAALQLERARETLARVQDLPPNSRARREAELAYAEADLNLRRAMDRNADLAKETEEANKLGVEGSKEVVEATKDVQEARNNQARAERDALRSQVDAEEQLAEARKESSKAGGGGGDALEGLTKQAQDFAKYIASLKPKIAELRESAQTFLLPAVQMAIQNLVDNLFPTLIGIVEKTGLALGKSAIDFSLFVTEGKNLQELTKVADTNNYVIGNLGTVIGNLYDSMLSLLTAADPLIRRFTDWIVTITTGWKETLEAKNATGQLTDTFNYAGDVAAQLGEIFHNIWDALMNIGKAAAGPGSGGEMLLNMFEESTQKFSEFTGALLASGRLEEFFRNVAENAGKVSSLVVEIVKQFLKLGENKAIGETADGLRTGLVPVLGKMLDILTGGSPALTEFINKLADFLLKFSETGSIDTFFGVLSKVLDVLNAIFGNEVVMKILAFTAPIMGAVKALGLLGSVGNKTVSIIAGYGIKAKKAFDAVRAGALVARAAFGSQAAAARLSTLAMNGNKAATIALSIQQKLAAVATKIWTGVQAAFNAVMAMNPVALIIIAIVALIAIIVVAYKKFEWFRDFVHAVWNGIKAVFEAVWNAIKTAIEFVWNNVIKPIFGAFKIAFELAWSGIKAYFEFVWNIISTAIDFVWNSIIKPVFEAFLTVFSTVWDGIKAAFELVWGVIKSSIEFVWEKVIKPIFEGIGTAFKKVWDGIKVVFETVINTIKSVFTTVWNGITSAITGIFGVFSDVFTRVKDFVLGAITKIVSGIASIPGAVLDIVAKVASAAMEIGKAILDGVLNGVKAVGGFAADVGKALANGLISAWNWVADKINDFVPNKIGWGPFSLDLPDDPIPKFSKLAKGGIVPATPGGMLALIGEAGRPERVEPLDPEGLSKRDREMISMLSGPGGGITLNVYPSKGMDEMELAAMISRQLAFQLRRGAA